MQSMNAALARQAFLAPLILRLVLGALLLYHGIDKFDAGISNVEGFFASNDVPAAGFTAPLVAVIEIVVGLALLLGIGTRIAAAIQIVVLVGALAFVKLPTVLNGGELDLAYIAGLAAIMLLGPGRMSVDEAMDTDETAIDLRKRAESRQPIGV
jgi:putative oxidoreductase